MSAPYKSIVKIKTNHTFPVSNIFPSSSLTIREAGKREEDNGREEAG